MQVILQPLLPSEGSSIVVDTNPQATISTLISAFCTQKGISFSGKLVIFDGKKRPLPLYSTLGSLGITSGQNLLIGYKDNTFDVKRQWPLLVALAALIIGVIGILTISMVYGLSGKGYPNDYGVVMDAGSSKTNTIVYKWKSNKHKGTGCVSQETNCNAKGGIAEMNPMKLDPVINCAKKVTSIIEPESLSKTPLYFAATAGMRLLNLTNPERMDQILEQLHNHLNETGLSVRDIEVISGRDEGIYGWITANFLQKTLEDTQKLDPWEPTTYGALDMGGASLQIAYALPEKEANGSSEVGRLKLYGQTHNVFAHSNLCFGRTEAERRYRFLLIKDPSVTEIQDPCLATGFVLNMTAAELLDLPCTQTEKYADVLKSNPKIMDTTYKFIGTSMPHFCTGNVSKLLDNDLCRDMNFKECFRKFDNLPEDQKYLAFATFFFTTQFLNRTKSSVEEYVAQVLDFCGKDYNQILQISKSEFITQYCFNAQYIYQVLVNGFNFRNTTWKNLEFVGKIAGKDVGWTLGYMINATNLLPEKGKTPKLVSAEALTVCLVLFIIVVIATVVYLLHTYKKSDADGTGKSLFSKA